MDILTDGERCFVDCRYHEILEGDVGPATKWIIDNGIFPHVFLPLFYARSKELEETGCLPTKPNRFMIPWEDKEEFLRRVEAIETDQRIDSCS